METIYAANVLGVFGWRLVIALFVLVAGVTFVRYWQRESKTRRDRFLGSLLLVGALTTSLYLMAMIAVSFTGGTRTLTAELTTKRAVSNAENSSYNLDFASAQTDFTVPLRAYDLVEEGQCYQVTYYHDYGKEYSPINLLRGEDSPYESSAHVAEIARSNEAAACQ